MVSRLRALRQTLLTIGFSAVCRQSAGPNWLPFSFGGARSLERSITNRLDGLPSRCESGAFPLA